MCKSEMIISSRHSELLFICIYLNDVIYVLLNTEKYSKLKKVPQNIVAQMLTSDHDHLCVWVEPFLKCIKFCSGPGRIAFVFLFLFHPETIPACTSKAGEYIGFQVSSCSSLLV